MEVLRWGFRHHRKYVFSSALLMTLAFTLITSQYFPTGPMPLGMSNPALRKPESSEDRHVIAKHSEIYPSVSRFI